MFIDIKSLSEIDFTQLRGKQILVRFPDGLARWLWIWDGANPAHPDHVEGTFLYVPDAGADDGPARVYTAAEIESLLQKNGGAYQVDDPPRKPIFFRDEDGSVFAV